MKKIVSTILLVLFALGICFSQDVITKRSGEEIQAKISEITSTQIKYNRFDNLNGPIYSIDKSEILMIRHENGTKDIFRNEGKKMSLCTYQLMVGNSNVGIAWTISEIYDASKKGNDASYYSVLQDSLISIAERSLNENRDIQYIPSIQIKKEKSEKPVTPDIVAKNNDLFACISAQSGLAAVMGWKKKGVLRTTWTVKCSSGYKVKIITSAESKERLAVFVDTADPKYEPVWLELQKESMKQFLDKLTSIMKKDKKMQ